MYFLSGAETSRTQRADNLFSSTEKLLELFFDRVLGHLTFAFRRDDYNRRYIK